MMVTITVFETADLTGKQFVIRVGSDDAPKFVGMLIDKGYRWFSVR